ncbi:hypothetical protein BDW75DRAFT_105912 [Aspergillus navahoensis]
MPYHSDAQLATATPIRGGLDAFARSFKTSCDSLGITRPFDPAALEQHKDFKDLLINLVVALQNLHRYFSATFNVWPRDISERPSAVHFSCRFGGVRDTTDHSIA